MSEPREAVVQALVAAAMEGMLPVAGRASGDEVLSAMMTLAYRAVQLCIHRGQDLSGVRVSVERIWALLPPEAPRA